MKLLKSLLLLGFFSALSINSFAQVTDADFARDSDLPHLEGKLPPADIFDATKITILNVDGEDLSFESLVGKVVVIDFWATWCGPCLRSIPHLVEIAKKHKKEVAVVGVHVTPVLKSDLLKVLNDKKVKYPIVYSEGVYSEGDGTGEIVASYEVTGIPGYYVLDKNGVLRFADLANAELDRALEYLLNE
ncbi:MAG: TlpA family protein disulfide reductase [Halobacteriovoraceae bacterium]|nr:TlpA family protein disulfide reductase [Halobacteriovoraceae bacterium]MCB9095308.1 TlpA family protein disulfide reductase [Halobacteriovoraceae bacterium]